MSAVETASMMSDVSLNISQLRILFKILRNKLGAKMCEPESIMKSLSRDMILLKFGEYKYYHEVGSKPEYILSSKPNSARFLNLLPFFKISFNLNLYLFILETLLLNTSLFLFNSSIQKSRFKISSVMLVIEV